MRGNLLTFIVLLLYNFVEIHAQMRPRGGGVRLVIPTGYNNLRVPVGKPKIDEDSNTCKGSLCLNGTEESASSTTNPGFRNMTILPTPESDFAEKANQTHTKAPAEGVTVSNSSNSSTEKSADTNRSTQVTTELPTTKQNGGRQKDGTTSPTPVSIFPDLNYEVIEYYDNEEQAEGYGPTIIDVALQIQSIREINEAEQKIIIDVDLMVHWKDKRLFNATSSSNKMENLTTLLRKFDATAINDSQYDVLWKPDIFIDRVVKIWKPDLMSFPHSIRYISQSSSIIYTTRASVKVDCAMNFEYYPADTQNCILDVRSYQNDVTKMELHWSPAPGAYLVNTETNDNFDLKLAYVARRKKRMRGINLKEAVYDVLQLKLSMRRRMTYHLLQTYLPSAFLVIITWLSFLIPEELIEGRIGISMTTLLTLTAMFSSVRENTPVVSYVRAIDIWMAYCIFTVFSTLLEFTFFVWLRNYKISKRKKKLEGMIFDLKRGGDDSEESRFMRQTSITDEIATKAAKAFEHTARVFNQFAFGFFVLSFVVFNLSYWIWLVLSSQHYRWEVDYRLNGGVEDKFGFFGDAEYGYEPLYDSLRV